MTPEEVRDMWTSAQTIGKCMLKLHAAEGTNFAMQDGEAAGQSVAHVHVHILPRTRGDFDDSDDVHRALEVWTPCETCCRNRQKNLGDERKVRREEIEQPNSSFTRDSQEVDGDLQERPCQRKQGQTIKAVLDDNLRKPRTLEEMKHEAQEIRKFLEERMNVIYDST
eukprot:GHVQ01013203.1.p1 GENE.GHVQ01013203.1~~GHVQ01013203.1.p1  ORF type:complete len:167 (+),score=21.42 GHVQ01013203.1:128-628(+)